MKKYENYTKEVLLEKIDRKRTEIVFLDAEMTSLEEDIQMLGLVLERLKEEE
jgi:hypothetical protein